jgi:hypothetical protein
MEAAKDELALKSEQLAMTVTCFKEKQVRHATPASLGPLTEAADGWISRDMCARITL